jgi:hypothetical protein
MQLLADMGGHRLPAAGLGNQGFRPQQLVALRQPDEARDQGRAVRASGVGGAIRGDCDDPRRLGKQGIGKGEVVRGGWRLATQPGHRIHQLAARLVAVAPQLGGQARVAVDRRRIADADDVARIGFDGVFERDRAAGIGVDDLLYGRCGRRLLWRRRLLLAGHQRAQARQHGKQTQGQLMHGTLPSARNPVATSLIAGV